MNSSGDPSTTLSGTGFRLSHTAAAAFCVASAVLAAGLFLPRQSLWVDEAAQMSGLILSPYDVMIWLSGGSKYDFGVPDDRMPPGSYWLGWLWSQVFGLSEVAMRWFGVTCVALATYWTFCTAYRAFGLWPAAAAAALFGVSPNVVVQAVEIRAYPVFLLMSSLVYYCLVRLALAPPGRSIGWTVALLAAGLAASYTHFFGLVVSGGSFLAVLIVSVRQRERLAPTLVAIGLFALLSAGLVPFVLASVGMSGGGETPEPGQKLMGFVRFAYRTFAHPAMTVSTAAVAACLTGSLLASVATMLGLSRVRQPSDPRLVLAIAVGSGVAVVMLTHLIQNKFAALAASYNVWMLPGIMILLASGLGDPLRRTRRLAQIGLSLLFAANVYGAVQLASRGEHFAHCAYRPVHQLLGRFDPDDVVVVYSSPPGVNSGAGSIYYPFRYNYGPDFRQYVAEPGEPGLLVRFNAAPDDAPIELASVKANKLVLIHSRVQFAVDVARSIHHGLPLPPADPIRERLDQSTNWRLAKQGQFGGLVATNAFAHQSTRTVGQK